MQFHPMKSLSCDHCWYGSADAFHWSVISDSQSPRLKHTRFQSTFVGKEQVLVAHPVARDLQATALDETAVASLL